jgi:ABC-2 type transport system permease protein
MTVLALASLAVGGMAVGGTLDAAGLGRAAVGCVLMGAALGGAAAVVVAWVRRGAAVTVLAIVVGGSYLVSLFVPMFGWPEWLNRLSVFWAIGHPYLAWPTAGGLATLLILAVPGALVAAAIAERTPKVA